MDAGSVGSTWKVSSSGIVSLGASVRNLENLLDLCLVCPVPEEAYLFLTHSLSIFIMAFAALSMMGKSSTYSETVANSTDIPEINTINSWLCFLDTIFPLFCTTYQCVQKTKVEFLTFCSAIFFFLPHKDTCGCLGRKECDSVPCWISVFLDSWRVSG